MSDRVAVMSQERYLQIDSPTRLYEAPANREVADFIGTMNFFEARVASTSADRVEVDAGPLGRLSVPSRDQSFGIGEPILAAIRPEKILLATQKPENGRGTGRSAGA
jgi:putrescine transport system ATP-binding protein